MVATRRKDYVQTTASTHFRRSKRLLKNENDKENELQPVHVADNKAKKCTTLARRSALKPVKNAPATKHQKRSMQSEPAELTGSLRLLPVEILELVLEACTPEQLGKLESSCKYFQETPLIEAIAKARVKSIPRAKDLVPNKRLKESWLTLLLFVTYQSNAAAQGTAVAFGSYHSAVLLLPSTDQHVTNRITHSVYTFGRGFHGQLGCGQYNNQINPTMVSLGYKLCLDKPGMEEEVMPAVVACGSSHTASISHRGELFTWGLASSGELGHNGWMPIEVNLPKQSLPMCHVRIVSVAAGGNHTLAISENGALFTCGRGRYGQLGNGSFNDEGSLMPLAHLKSWRIVSASAGKAHSMALAADGTLFTWGHGKSGQLGHPQLEHLAPFMQQNAIVIPNPQKIVELEPNRLEPGMRVTAISAGGDHSMALTVNGRVLVFGCNKHGQLGLGDTRDRWASTEVKFRGVGDRKSCIRGVQVVCGQSHSLVLLSKNGVLEARSTGLNSWGQLGLGDIADRHIFTHIPSLREIVALQSGDGHCGAVSTSGDLYVWGRGDQGQLGLGDDRSHWKPVVLPGFKVVHPDRTLRRHKRCVPNIRPICQEPKKKKTPANSYFQ